MYFVIFTSVNVFSRPHFIQCFIQNTYFEQHSFNNYILSWRNGTVCRTHRILFCILWSNPLILLVSGKNVCPLHVLCNHCILAVRKSYFESYFIEIFTGAELQSNEFVLFICHELYFSRQAVENEVCSLLTHYVLPTLSHSNYTV